MSHFEFPQAGEKVVVRAAAGTGKTVALTSAFLHCLNAGVDVERIIAITYTRRAAAELLERIRQVLDAQRLGIAAGLDHGTLKAVELAEYRRVANVTPAVAEAALSRLAAAPVGTIDSFVQGLLAEFALDARLPVGGGEPVPLDVPLATGGDLQALLTAEARALVNPANTAPPDGVTEALASWTLAELVTRVAVRHPLGDLPPATSKQAYRALAVELLGQMPEGRDPVAVLIDYLGLRPNPARWAELLSAEAKKDAPVGGLIPAVADWLAAGDDAQVPAELAAFWDVLDRPMWSSVSAKFRAIRTQGLPADSGVQLCAHLRRSVPGCASAAEWIAGQLTPRSLGGAEAWQATLDELTLAPFKPVPPKVAAWLAGTARDDDAPVELLALCRGFKAQKACKEITKHAGTFALSSVSHCDAIRVNSGTASAAVWLVAQLGLSMAPDAWVSHVAGLTKAGGKATVPDTVAWLLGSQQEAPAGLLPFLANLVKTHQDRVLYALFADDGLAPDTAAAPVTDARPPWTDYAQQVTLPVRADGVRVRLKLSSFDKVAVRLLSGAADGAMERETDAGGAVRAETLRSLVDRLRRETTVRALRRSAGEGALGYDELLAAATDLCSGTRSRVRGRFGALLVDEVQDSSPAQFEFYQALAATAPDMRAFYVGDTRQSIYMFRGAAPSGLDSLAHGARTERLVENFRSSEPLVQAQQALFDGPAMRAAVEDFHLQGLEPLADLHSRQKATGAEHVIAIVPPEWLAPADPSAPPEANELAKVSGTSANLRALERFAKHVHELWVQDSGLPPDKQRKRTMAVLAPTWALAAKARACLDGMLRKLPRDGIPLDRDQVFVDGGGRWTQGRVVRDLRIVLAALLDRSDQMAWLGLWKHPMVGLSDAGLARIRSGEGLWVTDAVGGLQPAEAWRGHLGHVVDVAELGLPHDRDDVLAFARARAPLRRAARDLAGRGVAEAIDELAHALGWRELLAVSPYDDALEHLELALEWFRDLQGQGQSARDILDLLSADALTDAPRLTIKRPPQHVSCTTVFQAKGLKYAHVCVLSPGVPPLGGAKTQKASLVIEADGTHFRLEPIRFDPDGAFESVADPISTIVAAVEAQRKRDECLRLAYVAVTRAEQSVVFALPNTKLAGAQDVLTAAWQPPLPNVTYEAWKKPESPLLATAGWVEAGEAAGEQVVSDVRGWWRQTPSKVTAAWSKRDRDALAVTVAAQVLAQGGLQTGGACVPRLTGAPWDDVRENHWGTLVHAVFAQFGFAAPPEPEALAQWLAATRTETRPEVAAWLLQVAESVHAHPQVSVRQLVLKPGVELYFELPLVGIGHVASRPDKRLLLVGRTDLLVRDPTAPPEQRWTVVDFKAGSKFPSTAADPASSCAEETQCADLVDGASLKTYAPQLEAYRAAVDHALARTTAWRNERVGNVSLWFVRAAAVVSWGPLAAPVVRERIRSSSATVAG